jgi:hypothetical protein
VNILITEEQLKKFKKHLKEEKNSLDALNNFIDKNKVYETGSLKIYLKNIKLTGDMDDPSIEATIDKVIFNKKDVTDFAINYALYDEWTSDDLPLATSLKIFIGKSLDRMVKRAFEKEFDEYNVVLHLFE